MIELICRIVIGVIRFEISEEGHMHELDTYWAETSVEVCSLHGFFFFFFLKLSPEFHGSLWNHTHYIWYSSRTCNKQVDSVLLELVGAQHYLRMCSWNVWTRKSLKSYLYSQLLPWHWLLRTKLHVQAFSRTDHPEDGTRHFFAFYANLFLLGFRGNWEHSILHYQHRLTQI